MIEVSISEFRQNIKKYAEMVENEDIIVLNNGKAVMKVSNPNKDRLAIVEELIGSIHIDKPYEEILKEKAKDY